MMEALVLVMEALVLVMEALVLVMEALVLVMEALVLVMEALLSELPANHDRDHRRERPGLNGGQVLHLIIIPAMLIRVKVF
jgi:hypothetical protein